MAKYSPLDHGGLEVVERTDLPEAVAPQRNSNEQPETLHPGQYQDHPGTHEHYGEAKRYSSVPDYDGPAYITAQEKGYGTHSQAVPVGAEGNRGKRKYCGMRVPIFIAVVVVIVLVVLGAVLGGVLGTVLSNNKHSDGDADGNAGIAPSGLNSSASSGPLEATENTGLATATLKDGSGTLLSFYQDPEGRVIVNTYVNGAWSLEDHTKINDSIVTDQAALGSPLAAISFTVETLLYRQVFFFGSTGAVMQVNSTDGKTWDDPSAITSDLSYAGTPALAACAGTSSMHGIRVYYGSNNGWIQEVGHDFTNATWNDWSGFADSDQDSGVACSVYQSTDPDHVYINVYFRNTTDGQVHQNYYDYVNPDAGWLIDFPPAPANHTIQPGSDIAVCDDPGSTEYIFWQQKTGYVVRAIVDPTGDKWEQFDNMQQTSSTGRLAASYIEGGSLYMFQNSSSDSTVWVSDVSRSSVDLSNIALPKR